MKTIVLLFAAFTISISVSAQVNADTVHHDTHHEILQKNHDRYTLRNGKIIMSKNGAKSMITQDVNLANGIRITTNGQITGNNGKTEALKEGQWIDMNGKVHSKKMKTSDKWNKQDDSHKK